MALSRPFVLAALAALLCAATFVSLNSASQRANADAGSDSAPVVTGVPAPKPATTSPKKAAPGQPSTTPKAAPSKAAPAAKPKPAPAKRAAAAGVPPRVKGALDAGQTVVLFFRQPAADDDLTAKAVNAVKGERGVKVFSDGIQHLARYRRVVSGLGISQAPAVVVVGKDKKATLLEGYVDAGTLKQQVKDAR